MRVNKTQLVDSVAEATGLSKADAQKAVDAVFGTITKALVQRDQVSILGIGNFGTKQRAARTGRDPRTGGVLQIPAAVVAFFKPGKVLKDAVNSGAVLQSEEN
jgi:DNA-binding protein HU-beta